MKLCIKITGNNDNVIRKAEVNYCVLQFDTKFNSVKQIWHNINSN